MPEHSVKYDFFFVLMKIFVKSLYNICEHWTVHTALGLYSPGGYGEETVSTHIQHLKPLKRLQKIFVSRKLSPKFGVERSNGSKVHCMITTNIGMRSAINGLSVTKCSSRRRKSTRRRGKIRKGRRRSSSGSGSNSFPRTAEMS